MARSKKAPASKAKAKAKKPSRRATSAKAVAKSAKKPAKAKKAVRPRQLGFAPTQPYTGQVVPFPFNFAPLGFATCSGQTLPISRYTVLFSLIGTTYGGNGTSNFMLPNLPPRGPNGPWYCISIDGAYPPRD